MNQTASRKARSKKSTELQPMLFTITNFKIIGVAILLLITGYLGMYIENEFTGFYALYIAPILLIAGYILVAFGIVWRDKTPQKNSPEN